MSEANLFTSGFVMKWTALMCAAQSGYTEIAKVLLERGADANLHDNVSCI